MNILIFIAYETLKIHGFNSCENSVKIFHGKYIDILITSVPLHDLSLFVNKNCSTCCCMEEHMNHTTTMQHTRQMCSTSGASLSMHKDAQTLSQSQTPYHFHTCSLICSITCLDKIHTS